MKGACGMKVRGFGKLSDGRNAGLYILRNSHGMEVSVTDYGATLASVVVPGRNGEGVDVVLGYPVVSGYEEGKNHFGAIVGRVANRVGNASFELNGTRYELTANNGTNSLHGGRDYYGKRLWQVKIPFTVVSSGDIAAEANALESMNDGGPAYIQDDVSGDSVTFFLNSPDGDQGYPGNLHIEVTYTLTNDNELHIDYSAVSDADTPLNLTNHSYFNLTGHGNGSALDQTCMIRASYFTPSDETLLPTGEIRSVTDTPFDFRIAKMPDRDISANDPQLRMAGGYDHNYVIDGEGYREAAMLHSDASGITMHVLTDMPGMQFYTGNHMKHEVGKGGAYYVEYSGLCFETQFFPDAVNKENFKGCILRAGEGFSSRTTYRFSF